MNHMGVPTPLELPQSTPVKQVSQVFAIGQRDKAVGDTVGKYLCQKHGIGAHLECVESGK
jgi:hypothetical protein